MSHVRDEKCDVTQAQALRDSATVQAVDLASDECEAIAQLLTERSHGGHDRNRDVVIGGGGDVTKPARKCLGCLAARVQLEQRWKGEWAGESGGGGVVVVIAITIAIILRTREIRPGLGISQRTLFCSCPPLFLLPLLLACKTRSALFLGPLLLFLAAHLVSPLVDGALRKQLSRLLAA